MSKKFMLLTLSLLLFSGCGQWNIFKWAHKEGTAASSDTTVLVADGQALLDKGDQASLEKAVEIFEKAKDANPRSSEANYGYAQAVIAASGLGLADLISSVIQQTKTSTGPVTALPLNNPFINFVSPQYAPGNLLTLSVNDLHTLYEVSIKAITPLKRIADGKADNIIRYDDFDVNFNLAFCLTIHSVCSILDWNGDTYPSSTGDIIEISGDFTVSKLPTTTDLDNLAGLTKDQTKVDAILTRVNTSLNELIGSAFGLMPSDYPPPGLPNKGALDYLITALYKIQPKTADTLRKNVDKFATDTNTGVKKIQTIIDDYYTSKGWTKPTS